MEKRIFKMAVTCLVLFIGLSFINPGFNPVYAAESSDNASSNTDTPKNGWDSSGTHYYRNGKAQTGFVKIDGKSYYFDPNGEFKKLTGLVKDRAMGRWVYIQDGIFTQVTGLVRSVEASDSSYGKWYYVYKGRLNENATGLVKCVQPGISNGKWYYVYKGRLNENATGLVKCIQPGDSGKGKWYYVYKGRLNTNATGMVQCIQPGDPGKGKWYYVYKGKPQNDATGLVKNIQPGDSGKNNWYYVLKGKLNNTATGLVKCIQPKDSSENNWYYVFKGKLDKSTGVVKCIQPQDSGNGKYYYVKNGKLNKTTGLFSAISPSSDQDYYYYVENGKHKIYTGLVNLGYTNYYFQNGTAPKWVMGPGSRGSYNHVIVSIGQQHLWFYQGGGLKVSTPVVTGKLNVYNTPRGNLALYSKGRNVRLIGPDWDSRVDYWMAIVRSQAYGLHSSYRSAFGGEIYKTNGSHGCINTPLDAVKIIYDSVSVGTPLYVTG